MYLVSSFPYEVLLLDRPKLSSFGDGVYLQSPKAFLNTLTPQGARGNSAAEPTRDAAECKLPWAARAQHTTYSLLKGGRGGGAACLPRDNNFHYGTTRKPPSRSAKSVFLSNLPRPRQ